MKHLVIINTLSKIKLCMILQPVMTSHIWTIEHILARQQGNAFCSSCKRVAVTIRNSSWLHHQIMYLCSHGRASNNATITQSNNPSTFIIDTCTQKNCKLVWSNDEHLAWKWYRGGHKRNDNLQLLIIYWWQIYKNFVANVSNQVKVHSRKASWEQANVLIVDLIIVVVDQGGL